MTKSIQSEMTSGDTVLISCRCKFCDVLTMNDGTGMCDTCWGLHSRLTLAHLDRLELIMASAKPEFLRRIRAEGFQSGADDERSRASVRPGDGELVE